MTGIHAVLFDLDGTLVDSLPGISWAAQLALTEVRPGCELPDLRAFVGPPIREVLRLALGESNAGTLADLEAAFRRHYNTEGWRQSFTYADVPDTLAALSAAGLCMGVVTNKPQAPTRRILDHLDLTRFMDVVVTPDSQSPPFASKTETLAAALQARGLAPALTLFVGDSEDDAAAACACGVHFAAVASGYGDAARQTAFPIAVTLDVLGDLCRGSASILNPSDLKR